MVLAGISITKVRMSLSVTFSDPVVIYSLVGMISHPDTMRYLRSFLFFSNYLSLWPLQSTYWYYYIPKLTSMITQGLKHFFGTTTCTTIHYVFNSIIICIFRVRFDNIKAPYDMIFTQLNDR